MKYTRMPIEIESPEMRGYENVPFNLTESSFTDQLLDLSQFDLKNVLLKYDDHAGDKELRKLIVKDIPNVSEKNVITTVGAASALFIVATSLLEKGDEMVVMRTNYMTNIDTPRMIGASLKFLDVTFENGFRFDFAALEKLVTENTKIVSITYPHNPTGVCVSEEELLRIIDFCKSKNLILLVDETYGDMHFEKPLPCAASFYNKAISVASLSKTYGVPGIRLGWLICQDETLMETFLAAKEQIFITLSVVDETIAKQVLMQRTTYMQKTLAHLKHNVSLVEKWIEKSPYFTWVKPQGGAVCFPKMKDEIQVDVEKFYQILNEEFGTFVGPGHWFEASDRHFRLGYGHPSAENLTQALKNIDAAMEKALG